MKLMRPISLFAGLFLPPSLSVEALAALEAYPGRQTGKTDRWENIRWMLDPYPISVYFIECSPTRFPSVSRKRAKWPYSSVIFDFGTTILPPAGSTRSRDSFKSSPALR